MQWDSAAYLRFKAERTQPSIDLVKRIDIEQPRKLLDVGCGPGNSTQVLADAFPNALRIIGIDSSPEMIEAAKDDHPDMEFRDLRCPEFALTWGGRVRRGVFQRLHPVGPRPSPAHPGHARPAPPRRNARRAGSHELQEPIHRIIGDLPPRTSGAPNSPPRGSSIRFPKRPISTSSPPKPDSSRCGRSPISTVCRPTRPSWIGIKARTAPLPEPPFRRARRSLRTGRAGGSRRTLSEAGQRGNHLPLPPLLLHRHPKSLMSLPSSFPPQKRLFPYATRGLPVKPPRPIPSST